MATIEEMIGEVKATMLLAVKEKIFLAAKEMVDLTPARTGRSRCSFVANIGAPARGTDPKARGGEIDHDGVNALAEIAAVIDQAQPGDKVFITTDYANAVNLDEGSRRLAPHQMAERAAADWSR